MGDGLDGSLLPDGQRTSVGGMSAEREVLCALPPSAALNCELATASAASEISTPVTCAPGTSSAIDHAMHPLPVHRSRTRGTQQRPDPLAPGAVAARGHPEGQMPPRGLQGEKNTSRRDGRGPALPGGMSAEREDPGDKGPGITCCAPFNCATANATSISVSGRGIRTPGQTRKRRPRNSCHPVMYCSGSPASSRRKPSCKTPGTSVSGRTTYSKGGMPHKSSHKRRTRLRASCGGYRASSAAAPSRINCGSSTTNSQ